MGVSLTKTCEHCCGQFTRRATEPPARWHSRRFCSPECANLNRRRPLVAKVCAVCGATFTRQRGEGDARWARRKLCGHACRGAFNERPVAERLESQRHIDETTGCWSWTGAGHGNGYAAITILGRRAYVHRVSHELYIGPIPEGMDVDHLCFNRLCFNPAHLEAVTRAENLRRARARKSQDFA